MKTKGRQLQRACKTRWLSSEETDKSWEWDLAVGPHWSRCQKMKMMQCALFYCDFWKQEFQHGAFVLSPLPPHLTELSKVFQAGCFDFVQMKASVELYINKLFGTAAKSELKTNCEKFDSELRELRMPDGLADSYVSSGMACWKGTKRVTNWSSTYTNWETGVNEPTTGHLVA